MENFNIKTTSEEVVAAFGEHVKGKTFVLTGAAQAGLGGHAAISLALRELAHIIIASRTEEKVKPILSEISVIDSSIKITFVQLDLTDRDSVRQAAEKIRDAGPKIDVLINNAGIMAVQEYTKDKHGVELQLSANYLGHYMLTNLLLPSIVAAGEGSSPSTYTRCVYAELLSFGVAEANSPLDRPEVIPNYTILTLLISGGALMKHLLLLVSDSSRVVNVVSMGYRGSPFRFDDWNFSDGKTYDPWTGYAQAKTASILFAWALTKRLKSRGVTATALHPGMIWGTHLGDHLDPTVAYNDIGPVTKRNTGRDWDWADPEAVRRTLTQGAATTLVAALSPEIPEWSPAYLANCQIKEAWEHATGYDKADRLWSLSEEIVGEKFAY